MDNADGFSLIELAIVLLIVGLLLGGLLGPISTRVEQEERQQTQKQLEDIKEALFGFALTNGRLPCPADPIVATGSVGAGTEKCSITSGVLPWVDLGVPETDAWGRRFTYHVTTSFMDAIAATTVSPPTSCTSIPTQSSFALCSEGNITITDGSSDISTKIPALVVSHGKNGYGAYTPQGSPPIPTTDAGPDESKNSNGDATYVSHAYTSQFDDIVTWLSLNILFNRMVLAGKLP